MHGAYLTKLAGTLIKLGHLLVLFLPLTLPTFRCNTHLPSLSISPSLSLRPSIYNVKQHKKYISGEKTEDELLGEFLKNFDTPGQEDNDVSGGLAKSVLSKDTVYQRGRCSDNEDEAKSSNTRDKQATKVKASPSPTQCRKYNSKYCAQR